MNTPKPWIESVHLHPDVLKENAETDIFALDLGPLADGSDTVAPVYRDAGLIQRGTPRPDRYGWMRAVTQGCQIRSMMR